jgi:uncharacterized protein (TIGR02145 family)
MMRIQSLIASVAFCTSFTSVSTPSPSHISFMRMADGKEWLTQNVDVKTELSYCYDDSKLKCRQYGRLYTWQSAQRACQLLNDGWRLPTDDEWRQLAKLYGGVSMDSVEHGKQAYMALRATGSSGFNAILGGGRSPDGQYARLEAHGFYWTASQADAGLRCSTTSVKAGKPSTAKATAKSSERFPFAAFVSSALKEFANQSNQPWLLMSDRGCEADISVRIWLTFVRHADFPSKWIGEHKRVWATYRKRGQGSPTRSRQKPPDRTTRDALAYPRSRF